jgi:hypothetical protein
VFRRVVATGIILGLQCFAWAGTGVHAHLDAHSSDDHHDGRVVHAHASGHSRAPSHHNNADADVDLHAPEDGATLLLDPFVAVETATAGNDAVPEAVCLPPAPDRRSANVPVPVKGGHDPPPLSERPSRAPPLA